MSEEIKTIESTLVKLERESFKTYYVPFYTLDNRCWFCGCQWESKEDAINSVVYLQEIKILRLVKVVLPVLMFDEDIDID